MKLLMSFILFLSALSGLANSACFDAHAKQVIDKMYPEFRQLQKEKQVKDAHQIAAEIALWQARFNGTVISEDPVEVRGIGEPDPEKSIIGSIQKSRYELLAHMMAFVGTEQEKEIYQSRVFQRVFKSAQRRNPEVTQRQLVEAYVRNIENGCFCRKNGRPYTFMRMTRKLLDSIPGAFNGHRLPR